MKDAIVRIELGAKPLLPADILENNEDASSSDDDDIDDDDALRDGKICYMLPVGYFEIGGLFHYYSTQTLVTIELPLVIILVSFSTWFFLKFALEMVEVLDVNAT